jgi:hypothetical protein
MPKFILSKSCFGKKPKYRNKKVKTSDGNFDSTGEHQRFLTLKILQDKGHIKHLKHKVPFDLIPGYSKKFRKMVYWADFTYVEDDKLVVEDFKSNITKTTAYKIKKHLMFHIHGILIKETGNGKRKKF